MLMLSRHRLFLRCVSLLTALTFLPTSVQAWSFLPQVQGVLLAVEEGPVALAPEKISELEAGNTPVPLTQDKQEQLLEDRATPDAAPANDVERHAQADGAIPGLNLAALPQEEQSGLKSMSREELAAVASEVPVDRPVRNPNLPEAQSVLARIAEADRKAVEAKKAEPVQIAQAEGNPPLPGEREVRGPLGPQAAVDALAAADALANSGERSEALIAYFDVMDTYGRTNEALWADQGMWNALKDVAEGRLNRASVSDFEAHLAQWTANSADGAYAAVTWNSVRALAEHKAGNEEVALAYAALAEAGSLAFLGTYPNSFLSMSVADYYQEIVGVQGWEKERSAMLVLRDQANEMEHGPGRLGALYAFGSHASSVSANAAAEAIIAWSGVLAEMRQPFVAELLNDSTVPFWAKGFICEYAGRANAGLGKYAEAKQWYDSGVALSSHVGPTHWFLAFMSALSATRMHPMNPELGVDAIAAYLEAYPNSDLASRAYIELGALFTLAGDYQGAAEFYSTVVQRADNEPMVALAQHELDYLLRNLYESRPSYAAKEPETPEQLAARKRAEKMCGPMALAEMLNSLGEETPADELADLAGTDDTGTTMLGLVDAATAKGIPLMGILASAPEELPLPAIAFVNHNHFVTLLEVGAETVDLYDPAFGLRTLSRFAFASIWDGQALIAEGGDREPLTVAALQQKGGDGTPQLPSSFYTPYEDYVGGSGGAGFGGNDPAKVAQGPNLATPTSSPGVSLSVNAYESALDLRETDLLLECRGSLDIAFGRSYINEKGYPRNPINGRMGAGWTSSLSVYISTGYWIGHDSYNVVESLVLQDSSGTARAYEWSHLSGGYDYFVRTDTGQTSEKGIVVKATHTTTDANRKYYVEFPDGRQYEFSAAQDDEVSVARLEYIRDAGAVNTVTLLYDNVHKQTGRLTKVQSPIGDTRHLLLSYDGSSRISKVELKASSTVLQETTYAYGANSLLTKVTDNGARSIQYSYGSQGGSSQYIDSITDKAGEVTDLDWSFVDDAGGAWGAYKLEVTPALGAEHIFERSVTSSVNALTLNDGVTDLSKSVATPLSGDASRTRYRDNYTDASTYNRWGYEYDSDNDLTGIVDPIGTVQTDYSYTVSGRISSVSNANGSGSSFEYTSGSVLSPTKTVTFGGEDVTLYYDANNRITKLVVLSMGAAGYLLHYDTSGQITSVTDPKGESVTLGFDNTGRITSMTEASGTTTTLAYDTLGNVTSSTDADSNTTTYEYVTGSCGACIGGSQLTKMTDPNNNNTIYSYDANGNRTAVTNVLNVTMDSIYDAMNRITKLEIPSGSGLFTLLTYDAAGHLSTRTDQSGDVTTMFYDFQGTLTKETDSVGTRIEYTYNALGQPSTITNGLGRTLTNDYDIAGQLTKVTYANGKIQQYFYDGYGRNTKVGAGAGGAIDPIEYFFDTNGKCTKVTYSAGGNTYDAVYHFDGNSRLTKLADWIDGTDGVQYGYDEFDRLTRLTDYDGSHLDYTYDSQGRVTAMNDYHGNATTYAYDGYGRLSTVTAPGSKVWLHHYDVYNRMTKVDLPNGMHSEYAFDSLGRQTLIAYKDGGLIKRSFTYAFSADNNITKCTHEDGAFWEYAYDSRDRLTLAERSNKTSPSILARYEYDYDLGNNMVTKEVPWYDDFQDGNITGWSGSTAYFSVSGGVMKNTADATVREIYLSESDADHDLTFDYIRYSSTGRAEVVLRSVGGNDQVYLELNTTSVKLRQVDGGTLTTLGTYTTTVAEDTWYKLRAVLDGTSVKIYWGTLEGDFEEILSYTTTEVTTGRAAYFKATANSEHGFDNIRLIAGTRSTAETFSHNYANEQTAHAKNGVTTSQSYDAWGRMTARDDGSHDATYTYRYGSKLYSVTSDFPGEGNVTYETGGDGKRRSRVYGIEESWFNYDRSWNVVSVEDDADGASGDLVTTNVLWSAEAGISPIVADIASANPSIGTPRYYTADHLGSTRGTYSSAKSAVGNYEHDPYGGLYAASGNDIASLSASYTGKRWDVGIQSYYAPFRYYSPNLSRWISRDPVPSCNLYHYVNGNPINSIDPDGRFAFVLIALVVLIAGTTLLSGDTHVAVDEGEMPRAIQEALVDFFNITMTVATPPITAFNDPTLSNAALQEFMLRAHAELASTDPDCNTPRCQEAERVSTALRAAMGHRPLPVNPADYGPQFEGGFNVNRTRYWENLLDDAYIRYILPVVRHLRGLDPL